MTIAGRMHSSAFGTGATCRHTRLWGTHFMLSASELSSRDRPATLSIQTAHHAPTPHQWTPGGLFGSVGVTFVPIGNMVSIPRGDGLSECACPEGHHASHPRARITADSQLQNKLGKRDLAAAATLKARRANLVLSECVKRFHLLQQCGRDSVSRPLPP